MARPQRRQTRAYGFTTPLPVLAARPIQADRAPQAGDVGFQIGQLWIYNSEAYILVAQGGGSATWVLLEGSGGTGNFTTLTSSGNTDLANGAAATSAEILNGAISGAATFEVLTANLAPATVNIATSAQANVVTIGSQTGAAATTIQSGTSNITFDSAASDVRVVALQTQQASSNIANDARVGKNVYQGLTTAAGATEVVILTNAAISATSVLLATVGNTGSNDAQMTLTRLVLGAGTATFTLTNNGAAALNGDIEISYWLLD